MCVMMTIARIGVRKPSAENDSDAGRQVITAAPRLKPFACLSVWCVIRDRLCRLVDAPRLLASL